ncbi:MAG: PaaI family thioesterase [Sinobacteraceae bacterium]|nr:PaaI family thioesterase [Nevskiaceae bacterium]
MTPYTPQDPDFATRVRDSFAKQAVMQSLGAEIAALEAGAITLSMAHAPAYTQQDGFMHAGIISTVLDSACGYAAFTLMPADARVLTIEFKINLLRPANAERYSFEARVTKAGRSITVCDGTAYGLNGGERKAIATMTGTLMAIGG